MLGSCSEGRAAAVALPNPRMQPQAGQVRRSARALDQQRAVATLLPLASLDIETPENLQLSEQNRLLEVDCRWQALACREHRELLSARGERDRPLTCPST